MTIQAFECTIKGTDWQTIINADTRGRAKSRYLRQVQDAWEYVKFNDVRCRSLGPPISSEDFKRTAAYRGMPDLRCGEKVTVGSRTGWVVGSDSSCNFRVLFEDGIVASVHPADIVREESLCRTCNGEDYAPLGIDFCECPDCGRVPTYDHTAASQDRAKEETK